MLWSCEVFSPSGWSLGYVDRSAAARGPSASHNYAMHYKALVHTLSHRLKRFEAHGIVTRTAYAETPPRVVYELTALGCGLRDVLESMKLWGHSA